MPIHSSRVSLLALVAAAAATATAAATTLTPILNSTNLWTTREWTSSCSRPASGPPSSSCFYSFLVSGQELASANIPPFEASCQGTPYASAEDDDEGTDPDRRGSFAACTLISGEEEEEEEEEGTQGGKVSAKFGMPPAASAASAAAAASERRGVFLPPATNGTTAGNQAEIGYLQVSYAFKDGGDASLWWNYTAYAEAPYYIELDDDDVPPGSNFTLFPTEAFAIA
ncbi:uncharacterized protein MKZ38_000253 [Zalerion maritima]|uniref:Uncharacterized protein n=1 Tax=Zalerion maritima TaxID=339359 RepID=A0AAD5RRT1_9PEZI|nr:uncharacterized protein MKZ38_000253 [Zalerion maritima]